MVVLPPTNEPASWNTNYILFWNSLALDLNRLTSSIGGPGGGPPASARFLAILHLAINDAYFAINPDKTGNATTYLDPNSSDPSTKLPALVGATDASQAVAGAANTVLRQLYTSPAAGVATAATNELTALIDGYLARLPVLNTLGNSYRFGVAVGKAILNLLDQGPAPFDQDSYRPSGGQYKFSEDPSNPIKRVPVNPNDPNGPQKSIRPVNAPFYGMLGKRIAVQHKVNGAPTEHIIADPPVGFGINNLDAYNFAFKEVYSQGGNAALNTTRRTPDQTTAGYFWAYDGSNLIGTPPRNYNQILRKIAVEKRPAAGLTDEKNNADFARLFCLANVVMGDAGIFAWQAKWCFEFWRPLNGVRQDIQSPLHDPFWLTLGAPETNTDQISFKPPFPSYPSGHATFGGAFFQAIRLYYKKRDNLPFAPDEADNIAFEATSEELNGISRDLRQPYDPSAPITDQQGLVRTDIGARKFPSLWSAIFENGISRIYLGVHWGFDAFAAEDVVTSKTFTADGLINYKAAQDIKYQTVGARGDRPGQLFPIGGVPLGIEIANDVFQSNVKPTPQQFQPSGRNKCDSRIFTSPS
ncbi:putative Vanadium chloroperoxidase [Glarea lozoyensis 74030]|uniref:Putative Vanadium chloroperoxidase n=1 Tax=Glarea lozoyensis (strain ATCC 74030 / MF5533) TaxID=1104152 RepID=H0EZN8_GLAL7|nr:putative Vanadium chloroperoxidase [Glarea lozoyensis 74030]